MHARSTRRLASHHFDRRFPAALLAFGVSMLAPSAHATIVWEGKEVAAWPDLKPPVSSGIVVHALSPASSNVFPHPSGVVHGLTILVDFSDQSSAYSKAEIDAWLNQAGYAKFGLNGSVRDYYLGQSNGKVDFQNEVHGFYRAKNPKSYYQGGTAYERADELWTEVIAALDAEIDFSKFDNDKDGKTEAISLLYAGNEGTFGKGLWPHASGSSEQRDGVRLNRYMMTALNSQPTNYVVAHESGHMLFGWPDLYGVGDYCIMANRGSDTNPVGINDAFRADQGWIPVMDVDRTSNARLSSEPDGTVYRFLNPARPTEYFLWSNVQNTAEWVSLKGAGLLVWHFDRSIGSNTPPAPLELAVVQAAPGSRQLGATTWPSPGSAPSDFFAQGRNALLSATTQPSTQWNDGSASSLRVYDISSSGPRMEFSVGNGPLSASAGSAGTASGGSAGTASVGSGSGNSGSEPLGGGAGASATGGAPSGPTPAGSGGVAGSASANSGGTSATAGQPALSGNGPGVASNSGANGDAANRDDASCSCRLTADARSGERSGALLTLGLVWIACRRRRARRT